MSAGSSRRSTNQPITSVQRKRIIPLTPVRTGAFSDNRYAQAVVENLERIQQRKRAAGSK